MKVAGAAGLMIVGALLGSLGLQFLALVQAEDPPVLEVSPTSLEFRGQVNGPPPDPRYLTLANSGGGVMKWSASSDVDWIVLGATQGKLTQGRAIQLLVWVDTTGMEAGEYRGTVTISAEGAQGSPTEVAVILVLQAPSSALLEVSPSTLEFRAEEGGDNPGSQTLTIRNAGGQPIRWSAQEDLPWLSLNRQGGALQPRQAVEVRVFIHLSAVGVGTWRGEIRILSEEAQNSPVIVPVTLVVSPSSSPRPRRTEPITLGAILPLTGPLQSFGPRFQIAAQLAIDEVNEAGGLLGGAPIELDVRDSRTNPTAAKVAAHQLVEEVEAIFGAAASGITLPVSSVTIPNQVVLISPSSSSPAITDLEDDDFVFRTAASDAMQGYVLSELAISKGYRRVAILARNDAYGSGLAEAFKRSFEAHGRTISQLVLYDPSTTDFSQQILEAEAGNPDAVSLITFAEGEAIIKQMVALGFTNFDLFVDGNKNQDLFDRVARSLGTALLEGKVGTAPALAPDAPGADAFEAAYRERTGEDPWVFTPHCYDALALLLLAIEKAGVYDGTAIRDALRFVANPPGEVITVGELGKAIEILRRGGNINYEGASGSVDFDENGDVPGYVGVWTIRNGRIEDLKTVYYCFSSSGEIRCSKEQ